MLIAKPKKNIFQSFKTSTFQEKDLGKNLPHFPTHCSLNQIFQESFIVLTISYKRFTS
jgi:hypothetical protein